MNQTLAERLLSRSVLIPMCGCRIWEGHVNVRDGYGQIRYQGDLQSTHRAAWIAFKGPIPEGLHVLHSCDVRPCINEDHLFLGTNVQNIEDSVKKGRRKGVRRNRPSGLVYNCRPGAHDVKLKIPRAKWLSVLQRLREGETQQAVAKSLGVSLGTIYWIARRSRCSQ